MNPTDAPPYDLRPWEAAYGDAIARDLPASPHANLAALIAAAGREHAALRAFDCVVPNGMNGRLSYAQVDALSDAFAAYLREELKLERGARVAVQLPNGLAYPVAVFGVFKAGCVLVNTNPLYTASEMEHQFVDSGAEALVISELFADKLESLAGRIPVRHVVVAGVPEFFPAIPRGIVRGVQRWWNRALPPIRTPHTRFAAAVERGRSHLQRLGGASAAARWWADVAPSDTACLQYTGGTTGVAKAAALTHGNLLANVQQILAMGGRHIAPGRECVLTALPLYHVFAFTANLLAFYSVGARNVLIPSPRPVQNLQRAIENTPVTWITGVNTLFNALLNEEWFVAFPPRTLKAAIAGGTALHPAVAERWRQVTRTPIAEGYGLTESSPVVSFNPLDAARRDSIGIPVPGTDVRLVDDHGQPVALGQPGELIVRGPQVMPGYWNQPSETAQVLRDGWLHTGDVAVMEPDGYFRIVDRKKDLILVSGFNVYPNEIEEAVTELEGVLEAAVVGVPDARSGEVPRLYVVKRDPALTEAEVLAHCRARLTDYKIPKSVVFRDELPKTPVGKILRKDLKAEVRAEFGPRSA